MNSDPRETQTSSFLSLLAARSAASGASGARARPAGRQLGASPEVGVQGACVLAGTLRLGEGDGT